MATVTHPLAWPAGMLRTEIRSARRGRQVVVTAACKKMREELNKLGARKAVITMNKMEDGENDPGVAVHFVLNEKEMCVAVDQWKTRAGNASAVTQIIRALRILETEGGHSLMAKAMDGFEAGLVHKPGESERVEAERRWPEYIKVDMPPRMEEVKEFYRRQVAKYHPDNGGNTAEFIKFKAAYEAAKKAAAMHEESVSRRDSKIKKRRSYEQGVLV